LLPFSRQNYRVGLKTNFNTTAAFCQKIFTRLDIYLTKFQIFFQFCSCIRHEKQLLFILQAKNTHNTEGNDSLNKFKPQKARGAAARLFNRLFEERKIYSSLVSDE